jgi:hypothetical protein
VAGLGGLEIRPLVRDLDNRFLSTRSVDRMCKAVADRINNYLANDCIFPLRRTTLEWSEVRLFYDAYLVSPYRLSGGGSQLPNLLWLYVLRLTFGATQVIDSGTFTGGSAWALSLGDDMTKVDTFDIALMSPRRYEPRVTYHGKDWMESNVRIQDPDRSLAYFDDHVNQIRRLHEAHGRGLRYLIFDDDVESTAIPAAVGRALALPKISFLFDDRLQDGEEIAWAHHGRLNRFRIDCAALAAARGLIEMTQRVPSLADITGIEQLGFRLVRLIAARSDSPEEDVAKRHALLSAMTAS